MLCHLYCMSWIEVLKVWIVTIMCNEYGPRSKINWIDWLIEVSPTITLDALKTSKRALINKHEYTQRHTIGQNNI